MSVQTYFPRLYSNPNLLGLASLQPKSLGDDCVLAVLLLAKVQVSWCSVVAYIDRKFFDFIATKEIHTLRWRKLQLRALASGFQQNDLAAAYTRIHSYLLLG